MHIYIAGPLFTEAEMAQRRLEAAGVREVTNALGLGDDVVFNPIDSPVNFKAMKPTASQIFETDWVEIKKSTHLFFDLSNADQGTFVELGLVLGMPRVFNKQLKIYPVISDIRIPQAGDYEGIHVPAGINQFVVGALEYYGFEIYSTFSDALDQFKKDVSKA